MFQTVPLSIIKSFSLYTQQCYMSYMFLRACKQDQVVRKPVLHIPMLCVQ